MHLNSSVLRSLVGWKRAILPADSNRCLRNGSKFAEQENTICIYKNTRQTNINTTMPLMSASDACYFGGRTRWYFYPTKYERSYFIGRHW